MSGGVSSSPKAQTRKSQDRRISIGRRISGVFSRKKATETGFLPPETSKIAVREYLKKLSIEDVEEMTVPEQYHNIIKDIVAEELQKLPEKFDEKLKYKRFCKI